MGVSPQPPPVCSIHFVLIGTNEGIEELTLTLLIGIKADLLQFILYPDKLLKLSNSLIILETETSKWSK